VFDHNAILGAHPALQRLRFANGFSGHGLQHAPAVGRGIAEFIVDGGWRSIGLSPLGWQRLLEQRPLREVNVV
jgi:glycine/D-amino acid oxidase-like deaminating enzyme